MRPSAASGSIFFYQNWLIFLLALWLSFLLTNARLICSKPANRCLADHSCKQWHRKSCSGAMQRLALFRTVRRMPMRLRRGCSSTRGDDDARQKGITKREPALCRFPFANMVLLRYELVAWICICSFMKVASKLNNRVLTTIMLL